MAKVYCSLSIFIKADEQRPCIHPKPRYLQNKICIAAVNNSIMNLARSSSQFILCNPKRGDNFLQFDFGRAKLKVKFPLLLVSHSLSWRLIAVFPL